MKIVMGSPFLYPAIAYGGAARAAYDLACSLQQLGHHVSVITTDVWDAQHRFNGTPHYAPFKIYRLKNLSNSMAYWCQFYTPVGFKKVDEVLTDADILHLHTYRNLLNDKLARLASQHKLPFVVTGHGTIPIRERFFKIKRVYDSCIGQWQLNHAAGFIAVSQSEKVGMKNFGLPESKIEIIPNGISTIQAAAPGKFREKWNLESDKKLVLFLGRITQQKGIQFVVKAFQLLDERSVLVIAGNDMGYENQIRKLIQDLKLEARVILTGILDDEEKAMAFTDADVTVYPAHDEAFGLVPAESILCGTPVIVCDTSGFAEFIQKSGGGEIVSWGDVSGLGKTIQSCLDSGKKFKDMENVKDLLIEQHNWGNVAKKTADFYEERLSRQNC
ncbi:glycosyltransferase family 4 protein [bacterium]|nr:glycosyltransferase family 4 protein [bacterium]